MTLQDIQNKTYELTGTDSTSYTNASMLINLNIWLQKIVGTIFDSQDESDYDDQRNTDYPFVSQALTINRDYKIPVSEKVLKIKDVSISYDGTNFYKAYPIDSGEFSFGQGLSSSTVQEATIDAQFARSAPRYDVKYNSIFIYPKATTTDVNAGAKMTVEWERQPIPYTSQDLTDGVVVPGFDDTFHPMLSYGASYEYAMPKRLKQLKDITEGLNDYEVRLRRQYNSKQKDRKYRVGADYQNYK